MDEMQSELPFVAETVVIAAETSATQPIGMSCAHPGFFKGLCMVCGQMEEDTGSGVPLGYIHKV